MKLPLNFSSGIQFNLSKISIKFSVSIDDDEWCSFNKLLLLHRIGILLSSIYGWMTMFIHCYLFELLIFFIYIDKICCHHGHCNKYPCIRYHDNVLVHNNKFIISYKSRVISRESFNILCFLPLPYVRLNYYLSIL